MATKTKLKNTTSISPVTEPVTTSPLLLPPNVVMDLMHSAYDDTKVGSDLTERGSQRSVCAVMYHMYQVINDGKSNHALRDCALGSAHGRDTREAINAIMVEHFVDDLPDTTDMSDDETANARRLHDNHKRLVKRSVTTAGILEANGVVATDFNHTTGMFTVPSTILYPNDAVPLDRLLDNASIDLDGGAITYRGRTKKGGTKTIDARASIRQVQSMQGPAPKSRTPKVQGDTPTTTASSVANDRSVQFTNAEDVGARVPLTTLIEALHNVLIESGPAEPIARDALPDSAWNMLSDIMQRYDESKAAWASVKPVKKAA